MLLDFFGYFFTVVGLILSLLVVGALVFLIVSTKKIYRLEFWSLEEEHEVFDFPGQKKSSTCKIPPGIYLKYETWRVDHQQWIRVSNDTMSYSCWVKLCEADFKVFTPKKTTVLKNGKKIKVVLTHITTDHIWGYVGENPDRSIIHLK